MDLSSLRTLARRVTFATLGVDATVTRPYPDDAPITTRVIWITPVSEDFGNLTGLRRRESKRLMAFRRDQVPTVPIGTTVLAPEPEGGTVTRWKVEAPDRIDSQTVRMVVIADPDATE